MMKFNRRFMAAAALACATLFSGCDSDSDPTPDQIDETKYNYLLALSLPTTDSYPFHTLKSISSGTADISDSQEIPSLPYNVVITAEDGYVYLNSEQKLTKYAVGENGLLKDMGSVANLGISGGPVFEFLDAKRLLISSGPRVNSTGNFNYQIINTETMTEMSTGSISLPVTGTTSTAIPSAYILRDGKIYVPYIHTNSNYEAYNKAPVAIFNASTMAYEKTIYTSKTASLGYSIVNSHAIDEKGDLYLASCNSNYWGANESMPSGIVRIKAGQTEFDDSYFFNLTEKLNGNHTGGMLYVGNGKALVQVFRSDLITKYKDYQGAFVIEYYEVDLNTKAIKKLNIPLAKYPRRAMAMLQDGKAAIVGNTQNEGNNIYIYDPATGSVTKGLQYNGTEYIEAFTPLLQK